jgi:hypothetical protein
MTQNEFNAMLMAALSDGMPSGYYTSRYNGEEIDNAITKTSQLTGRNLLDNWYFVNPINQRGLDSYANSSGLYGIDRWKILSGLSNFCYVEINDGYVSIVNANTTPGNYIYVAQYFEHDITPAGVPRTVSIMDKDGIVRSSTNSNVINWVYGDGIYIYQGDAKSLNIRLDAGKRLNMKAIKLELGPSQTIAHQDIAGNWMLNEIPDYGEQLARCQRYYQIFATQSVRPTNKDDFRPVMRTTPALSTITIGSTTYYTASAEL